MSNSTNSAESIIKLQNELNNIQTTKGLMRTAITAKGSAVGENDSFRSYVDRINAIELGKLTNQEYTDALALADYILGVQGEV